LWRNGKEVPVKVKIALLDPRKLAATPSHAPEPAPEATVTTLGLSLAPITPQLRRRFQLSDDVQGVVVTAIAGNSWTEEDVAPGDVVASIGRDAVATPEEVVEKVAAARQARRKTVLLRFERKGAGRYVAVPIDRR
ncbi:MAG: serine protease, partial [Stellaceae bacterium]